MGYMMTSLEQLSLMMMRIKKMARRGMREGRQGHSLHHNAPTCEVPSPSLLSSDLPTLFTFANSQDSTQAI